MSTFKKSLKINSIAPKSNFKMKLIVWTLLITHTTLQNPFNGDCFEFNRDLVGVVFQPYVKQPHKSTGKLLSYDMYSLKELKTMLQVISTKFSRLITERVHVMGGTSFISNFTYYYDTYVWGRTAEAAALINMERQKMSLNVVIGIHNYDEVATLFSNHTALEVNVALEAAKIANNIYSGTVTGFAITTGNLNDTMAPVSVLHWLGIINGMKDPKTEVGIFSSCDLLKDIESRIKITSPGNKSTHSRTFGENVSKVDFITCVVRPGKLASDGAEKFTHWFSDYMVDSREKLQKINPKIKVVALTNWPSKEENNTYEDINNFVNLWTGLNSFAIRNNISIFLKNAIDVPYEREPSLGWWKLRHNELSEVGNGYIDKVSEFRHWLQRNENLFPRNGKRSTGNILHRANPNPKKMTGVENPHPTIWIISGSFIGLTLPFLICGLIIYFRLRLKQLQQVLSRKDIDSFRTGIRSNQGINSQSEIYKATCQTALEKPYDVTLEIPKHTLKIAKDEILGSGQFGQVYKAVIDGPMQKDVALKTTKPDSPACALKGLLSEIKIMTYLGRHDNLVNIIGAYTAELEKGLVYLALELCTGGSLRNHLMHLKETNFTSLAIFLEWSNGIACGMEHLEQRRVIHADLATRNILLSSSGTVKISDFGLSRRLQNYSNYVKSQQEPLPWQWMAIESLKDLEFSHFSDVWSYGVTLWEIYSLGDEPFPYLTWSHDYVRSLENGVRLQKPELASSTIYQIMLSCWEAKSTNRPTFRALRHSTKQLLNECCYLELPET